MKVSYCSKTDVGLKHPINSDALGDKKTKNGHVFVVADGSPVDANGSFASRLAVQSILDYFEKEVFDNIFIGINHAFQFANEQVYRASILEEGLKGVFASVALVLFREEGVYHAHIGNSRVYLKSEGKLQRLTVDHGFLDVQLYPSNDVDYSKPPVKLPKALGNTPSISPTICNSAVNVAAGDVFIVCTNGITKVLDDNYLNNKVEYATINSNILELVDAAKGKSVPENVTLQLISVTEGNIQKRVVATTTNSTSASASAKERVSSIVNESTATQEQINFFNKISLDRKKTIKIGAGIIAVFLLIWFVFRQPHDDTDKVLDDAGEVIAKDTTNQHQDLEELMEYEKPKKAEKEEEEEEETEEDVVEEETSEVEPADVTAVDETSTTKEEVSTTPKKEEKKKEEKKSEKDSKKEDKKEKSGKTKSHTVKSGDTINALAIKYGVKAEAIRKANNISDDKIEIGQELKIPQ